MMTDRERLVWQRDNYRAVILTIREMLISGMPPLQIVESIDKHFNNPIARGETPLPLDLAS